MKVLIDADACPVVDIAISLCEMFSVECLLLCDTAHTIHKQYAQTLVFDKGSDSVDFALVNRVVPKDIVITQDYGRASMCLGRGAYVLHQDGWEYTEWNITGLMEQRHAARRFRAAGGRTKGPSKRTQAQNDAFRDTLHRLLQQTVQG